MTRPMSEEERSRVLRWAQMFVRDCEQREAPPLHTSGDATLDLCRALLSTSSAERGMREALEKARIELAALTANPDDHEPYFGIACPNDADAECVSNAYEAIRAALPSKGEG